ncbi:uncharacterized protein N7459_008674 [Penicillium hispanicum]|uniref:uncharacterized protein n=1 Tax=Penicillium hispanicum TaxID=1080232 RepID=UPI00253FA8BB|nr:uncharacterized protein N7459_008674 [Penicillium hispanicum]KAJ5574247.1 hypothetical protein N7459_008674 [Penicillium hispanicum]
MATHGRNLIQYQAPDMYTIRQGGRSIPVSSQRAPWRRDLHQFNTAAPYEIRISHTRVVESLLQSHLLSLSPLSFTLHTVTRRIMPHKVTNDSNSTLASRASSGDQVVATEARDSARLMQTRPSAANPVRKPPVIVHNKGGQIYDETRPSDWDKQRWK